MWMVELVHVPPSVGISAPEAARTGDAERKPVIKTKRTMRRTRALNARILFRTSIRHNHGLFVGSFPIDHARFANHCEHEKHYRAKTRYLGSWTFLRLS